METYEETPNLKYEKPSAIGRRIPVPNRSRSTKTSKGDDVIAVGPLVAAVDDMAVVKVFCSLWTTWRFSGVSACGGKGKKAVGFTIKRFPYDVNMWLCDVPSHPPAVIYLSRIYPFPFQQTVLG